MLQCKSKTTLGWEVFLKGASELEMEEATFEASPQGIALRAMDSGHLTFMDCIMQVGGFEVYNCPETFAFTLKTEDLNKIIAAGKKDDSSMSVNIEDRVEVILESNFRRSFKLNFSPGQAMARKDWHNPVHATFTIDYKVFEKMLDEAQILVENLGIMATNDNGKLDVKFFGIGNNGDFDVPSPSMELLKNLEVKQSLVRARYQLGLMQHAVAVLKLFEAPIQVDFATDVLVMLKSSSSTGDYAEFRIGPVTGK
jgi:proliferating cell nuclear antigen